MSLAVDYAAQNQMNSALVRRFLDRAFLNGQAIRLAPSLTEPDEIVWSKSANETAAFTGCHAAVLLREADDLIRTYPDAQLSREEALLFIVQGHGRRQQRGLQ